MANRPLAIERTGVGPCAAAAVSRWVLFACLALWLTQAPGPARCQLPAARVEGVAALVGGNVPGPDVSVILRSDVELRARMNLIGQTDGGVALVPVPPELLKASLQELISEALIVREARRIRTAEPQSDDLRAERQRLAELCGGSGRLARLVEALGVHDDELRAIVQRRALVASFLTSNLEGTTAVTEAQVDAALQAAGQPDPAMVPDDVRREVAASLSRQALHRSVERWVRVLQARMPVRIYARFERT